MKTWYNTIVPHRYLDWLKQAERDLGHARFSLERGDYEWACFAAQQAAEEAVKALHLFLGQEAWGHVVAKLLRELPIPVPEILIEKGKVLDGFYILPRYPNGFPLHTLASFRPRRLLPMPVRSLHSSVLRWPDRNEVEKALRAWAQKVRVEHPETLRIGYFGSYATESWGVGSDVDIVIVVAASKKPFMERPQDFDTTSLPVPADLFVYTAEEFAALKGKFSRVLREEAVWIVG